MEKARPFRPNASFRRGRSPAMAGGTFSVSGIRPEDLALTWRTLRPIRRRVKAKMLWQIRWDEDQPAAHASTCTLMLKTSPGSHSTATANGRQQTSQSVVNRCVRVVVSITRSKLWPQNGHCMVWLISTFDCRTEDSPGLEGIQPLKAIPTGSIRCCRTGPRSETARYWCETG